MQTEIALAHLQRETLDQNEARKLGIVNLQAVISKLRKLGHDVQVVGTKPIPIGDGLHCWVAEYGLK